jgi:peptide chain release factor
MVPWEASFFLDGKRIAYVCDIISHNAGRKRYGEENSMAIPSFAVSEGKNRLLREMMAALGVREEDMAESFIRSSGKGGQHVNKTSSCVYLRHLPTGLEVKCGTDRSQSVNRFLARRELLEKIARLRGETTPRDRQREAVVKKKAKRRKRAKMKYGTENGEE